MTDDMMWYQARFEDSPYSGPYDTKEEAIETGRGEWDDSGFYVCQAANDPIKLADWIGADGLIERAEDCIFDNYRANQEYDDQVFTCTPKQRSDLTARIKKACDDWQEFHGLAFSCNTFSRMTNPEFIPAIAEGGEA